MRQHFPHAHRFVQCSSQPRPMVCSVLLIIARSFINTSTSPKNASSQNVNVVGRLWGGLFSLCKLARIRGEVDVLMNDRAVMTRTVQSMRRRCKLCILNETVHMWKVFAHKMPRYSPPIIISTVLPNKNHENFKK